MYRFDILVFIKVLAELEDSAQTTTGFDVLMCSLDFFSGVQRRGKPCCNDSFFKNTFEDGLGNSSFPSSYAWLYPTWKCFYSMKNTKRKNYLQITCTNSSECAAFSLISMILPNKSLIVCLASSTSFSTERPT